MVMPEQEASPVEYVLLGAMNPGLPQSPAVPSHAGQP